MLEMGGGYAIRGGGGYAIGGGGGGRVVRKSWTREGWLMGGQTLETKNRPPPHTRKMSPHKTKH